MTEIKDETALAAFSKSGGLDSIINETRLFVRSFKHDLSTEVGRKKTKSLGHKVSKLKTKLDALGKSLTDDWAQKKKAVDINRKSMRDDLDELKAEAIKSVVKWEDDQRVAFAASLEAQRLIDVAEQKETDHEIALLFAGKYDRELADNIEVENQMAIKRQAEQKAEQEVRDKKIAADATAKIIADGIARDIESVRLLEEAKQATQKLADDKILYEKQKKIHDENVEVMRLEAIRVAKIKADQLVEEARLDEIQRQKDAQQVIDKAKEVREADQLNTIRVLGEIKADLMWFDIDEPTAKAIALALHRKQMRNLTVQY